MTQKETNFYFFSARVSKPLGVRWLSGVGEAFIFELRIVPEIDEETPTWHPEALR
jgi:hypothetical protein